MGLITSLGKRSRLIWMLMGFALVAFLGLIDYLTGFELSITLFYLIPIFLVTWFTDGKLSLVICAVSAITWFLMDYLSGLHYSNLMIYVWNTLIRLGFFIITTRLLLDLRNTLRINQELARVDYVTGAASVRFFYEMVQIEINRSQRTRHPLSLVYLDLDNFKDVNDNLGHTTGDQVLRTVADCIKRQIRPADMLARLGGDEFALLLPETGEAAVKPFINRIHASLAGEMLRNGWMVTFSIGVITCLQVPGSVDEMVKLADRAMYEVKTTSKNGVRYHVCGE